MNAQFQLKRRVKSSLLLLIDPLNLTLLLTLSCILSFLFTIQKTVDDAMRDGVGTIQCVSAQRPALHKPQWKCFIRRRSGNDPSLRSLKAFLCQSGINTSGTPRVYTGSHSFSRGSMQIGNE